MTYQQKITHYLGQSIGLVLRVFKWHPKKPKSNPISLEESNKISQKIPSQDSNSEIEWDIEDIKQAYVDAAEQSWDKFSGG